MAAAKQPANQPLLVGDSRQMHPAWSAWFDGVSARLRAIDDLPRSTSYASDAAAAAGGVPVGGLYRNGSAVMVRLA